MVSRRLSACPWSEAKRVFDDQTVSLLGVHSQLQCGRLRRSPAVRAPSNDRCHAHCYYVSLSVRLHRLSTISNRA